MKTVKMLYSMKCKRQRKIIFTMLFAMAGTIYVEDKDRNEWILAYNIAVDIPAAQRVFNSSSSYFGLAPVDTTVFMQFSGSVW